MSEAQGTGGEVRLNGGLGQGSDLRGSLQVILGILECHEMKCDGPNGKEELARIQSRCESLQDLLMEAAVWMAEDGCDCGTDEPGTCGLCRIQKALEEA